MITRGASRAIGFDTYGGPEVLHAFDRTPPSAGPGEVVVEVQAAAVNPTDLLMRAGAQAASMEGLIPPYVPGMEFAGVIVQLGGGVSEVTVGTQVMGIVDPRRPEGGAYAQHLVVPAASVTALLDPEPDWATYAGVPLNGLTANLSLEKLDLQPGMSLLITGGAGVLGGYCIQLARVAGLVVIADARASDQPMIDALGGSIIVERGAQMAEDVRAHFPNGVDGAIDAARIGADVLSLVRTGGRIVHVRSTDVVGDARVDERYVSVLTELRRTDVLRRLEELVRTGLLTGRVAREYAAEDAAAAHHRLAEHAVRERLILRFS